LLQKLLDMVDDYNDKIGKLFISGISAFLLDYEGFLGPVSLHMGYTITIDEGFYLKLEKFLNKKNIGLKEGDLFDENLVENLYRTFLQENETCEQNICYQDEFEKFLSMYIKGCIPQEVYFVVNEGEYMELEEVIKANSDLTDWESLNEKEIEDWINDLQHAPKSLKEFLKEEIFVNSF